MGKRFQLAAHLSIEEIERRYRASRDGIERSHWQIIWLLAQGQSMAAIATATGYSTRWISTVAHRYNAQGAEGLGDQRHTNPGPARLLSAAQQADLRQALTGLAPDGGQWSGPKVALWLSDRVGRRVPPQRGWVYLRLLGFRPLVPRPRHVKADADAQAAFKKNSPRV
jgi:transposase